MNKNREIQLSEETLNEMDMDNILGGHSEGDEASNNCLGGDCAAGCSIGEGMPPGAK